MRRLLWRHQMIRRKAIDLVKALTNDKHERRLFV